MNQNVQTQRTTFSLQVWDVKLSNDHVEKKTDNSDRSNETHCQGREARPFQYTG